MPDPIILGDRGNNCPATGGHHLTSTNQQILVIRNIRINYEALSKYYPGWLCCPGLGPRGKMLIVVSAVARWGQSSCLPPPPWWDLETGDLWNATLRSKNVWSAQWAAGGRQLNSGVLNKTA